MRLDIAVSLQFDMSRQKAKELIEEGKVLVDGKKTEKASKEVGEQCVITVTETPEYVSRGGYKLKGALEAFDLNVEGLVCIDIGASTGGFTDCLLKHGAKKVYAIDVGTAQLHESLKNDSRVISLEQTDIRNITPKELGEMPELAVCDVSFISLKHILEPALSLCKRGVFLIKPQFELDRGALNKQGVVKKEKDREKAVSKVKQYAVSAGFRVVKTAESPITGKEGNKEYLIYLEKEGLENEGRNSDKQN